jgi:hypothetical protein
MHIAVCFQYVVVSYRYLLFSVWIFIDANCLLANPI